MPLSSDGRLGPRVRTQVESGRQRLEPQPECSVCHLQRRCLFCGFCIRRWRISAILSTKLSVLCVFCVDWKLSWWQCCPSGPMSSHPQSLDCSRRIIFLLASPTRSEAKLPPSEAARGPPDSISDKGKYQRDTAGVGGGGLLVGVKRLQRQQISFIWGSVKSEG